MGLSSLSSVSSSEQKGRRVPTGRVVGPGPSRSDARGTVNSLERAVRNSSYCWGWVLNSGSCWSATRGTGVAIVVGRVEGSCRLGSGAGTGLAQSCSSAMRAIWGEGARCSAMVDALELGLIIAGVEPSERCCGAKSNAPEGAGDAALEGTLEGVPLLVRRLVGSSGSTWSGLERLSAGCPSKADWISVN